MILLVKNRVWPSLGYVPHSGQQEIHDSSDRHRVAACGRRFGKTIIGGHELTVEALRTYTMLDMLKETGKARRFWIVGPDYSDDAKEFRAFWDDLERLGMPLDHPGSHNRPEAGNMRVQMFKGRFEVETKSAKHPDSLDGEGLCGALLVEAAKLKPQIWDKYIRPALADERGWSLHTSTPEGKNHFYDKWQRGQDPGNHAWNSWRMPSWRNTYIFPEGRVDPEILDMEQDMSRERFAQEIEADFTEYVGRVFKDFDEELHVTDIPFRPDLPLYAATDYGYSNPWVWLAIQVDVFNNVYVIGEYRTMHTDIEDITKALLDIPWARNASDLYPEPADPGDTAYLQKKMKLRVHKNTGGELKWRLELIRKFLKYDPVSEGHPDEKRDPKLFIDRKCHGLIREMLDYRYPDTKEESLRAQPEEPLDKDNHGPEALGRFMRGYFGGPGDEDGQQARARVRRAVIRSGS